MKRTLTTLIPALFMSAAALANPALTRPIASPDLVFEESDGFVAVEAEHFFKQDKAEVRAWYLTTSGKEAGLKPDADGNHVAGAGGGAYLEILPDTRKNHGEKLINGENFINQPGKMAVLSYKVHFNTPGKYYVWARTHSTGTEDNGLHVGIDGTWPASGQRMQWTAKRHWAWGSKQRTEKVHGGVKGLLYLDVEEAGEHTIHFSMREDGFEFDGWIMTTDPGFEAPAGAAPASKVKSGKLPKAFKLVPAPENEEPVANPGATRKKKAVPAKGEEVNVPPKVSGELKQWHKITLSFDGPETSETATPNPFTDYRLDVTFSSGETTLIVPGFYAADGRSADTSASSGNKWHVHFSPPAEGKWKWMASFQTGPGVAMSEAATSGTSAGYFDGANGTLKVSPSNKKAPDFRALGRLVYNGTRYPHTLGTGEIFLKAGADAPENFLAYSDFDGGFATDGIKDNLVKNWEPHVRDWKKGDPAWKGGKGKGMIGAINYLASQGLNAFSFLTMNIGGDDENVFPYLDREQFDRLDVSRLAQWETAFSHATSKGLFLHFKTQESENELLLDGGDTGKHRRLYYRELIARFSHHPALNWNLGEENGRWNQKHQKKYQTTAQRLAMGRYFEKHDPYKHPIVIHNGQWFDDLYGPDSPYNGASLQTSTPVFKNVHNATRRIIRDSAAKGKAWMVACDEPGDAQLSLVPDAINPSHDNARQGALWGNFLAGGWGVEWYFGYKNAHSDLTCQDYRSRELMWIQCRHALEFFHRQQLPLGQMNNHNEVLNSDNTYCLAKPGHIYLALIRDTSEEVQLDLGKIDSRFEIQWFNPRDGGVLQTGSVGSIKGPGSHSLGNPPSDSGKDWVVLVNAKP